MKRSKAMAVASFVALAIFFIVDDSSRSSGDANAATPAPGGNPHAISAAQLQAYLSFIASDELEGRDTPSRGLNTAAKFIATQLTRSGLKPVGDDGTYFQHIALQRLIIDPVQTVAEIDGQSFRFGEDFLAQPNAGTVSGPLVYVSHGWVIKSKNIDAYQGIEVKDKIMVSLAGFPEGVSFRDLTGKRGEDWESPSGYAQKNGAIGQIVIPNFNTLSRWERNRQNALSRGMIRVEKFQESEEARVPEITLSPRMADVLFDGEEEEANVIFKRSAAGEPVAPFDFSSKKSVRFTIAANTEPETTQNVVAVLEGSDRKLNTEYVAIGAHYDHVGIGRPVAGDSIYNGADDDGSGTVTTLAIAEAFARGPRPKRSILFVWHAGEEKGLWGSKYITEYPIIPLDQITAQLNIDMIGRSKKDGDTNPRNSELSGPNEIYVIGSKMMSSELGKLSEKVNNGYLKLQFNYKYDDPKDPHRFFFRSDHYNYAQKGIPIIFYFDGEHQDYHRPSDSFDKIDYQKMEKVARTIYATAWELANISKRPTIDKQLPVELTRR